MLAAYMRRYPHLGLYVDSDLRDLEFLRHFPWLRTFSFLALGIESIDGLLHVAENLRILELSPTRRRLSLTILKRLPHLDRLGVDGHWQGLSVLGDLPSLRALTLSRVKVDSLDFLRGATGLAILFLRMGRVDDISDLASLPHLQELTVYRTKIRDLAPLSDCVQLGYLELESVAMATLPDLSALTRLKVLWLANLRGVDDLFHAASDQVNGAPRILADLREAGEFVSRKTVGKLMRNSGIRGISPRPWRPVTTISGDGPHAIPDLVERRFDQGAPESGLDLRHHLPGHRAGLAVRGGGARWLLAPRARLRLERQSAHRGRGDRAAAGSELPRPHHRPHGWGDLPRRPGLPVHQRPTRHGR